MVSCTMTAQAIVGEVVALTGVVAGAPVLRSYDQVKERLIAYLEAFIHDNVFLTTVHPHAGPELQWLTTGRAFPVTRVREGVVTVANSTLFTLLSEFTAAVQVVVTLPSTACVPSNDQVAFIQNNAGVIHNALKASVHLRFARYLADVEAFDGLVGCMCALHVRVASARCLCSLCVRVACTRFWKAVRVFAVLYSCAASSQFGRFTSSQSASFPFKWSS